MTSWVLGKLIRHGSEVGCSLDDGRPPQGTSPSGRVPKTRAPIGFQENQFGDVTSHQFWSGSVSRNEATDPLVFTSVSSLTPTSVPLAFSQSWAFPTASVESTITVKRKLGENLLKSFRSAQ